MKKVLFSTTALAAAGALAFGASDALAQSKAKKIGIMNRALYFIHTFWFWWCSNVVSSWGGFSAR